MIIEEMDIIKKIKTRKNKKKAAEDDLSSLSLCVPSSSSSLSPREAKQKARGWEETPASTKQ